MINHTLFTLSFVAGDPKEPKEGAEHVTMEVRQVPHQVPSGSGSFGTKPVSYAKPCESMKRPHGGEMDQMAPVHGMAPSGHMNTMGASNQQHMSNVVRSTSIFASIFSTALEVQP